MKNSKGIILSTYIYILLVFFIVLLATMLLVLNNTKLLATKIKENASDITKSEYTDFNIVLIGDKNVNAVLGVNYVDDGYVAESKSGKTITATVTSTVNINATGDYTYKYTIIYGGISKSVTRNVKVINPVQNYDYTGGVQTFVAPLTGYYKLEVWGAQGGQTTGGTNGGTISTITPGYGGYSTGVTYLTKNQKIYIYVGGAGQANCAPASWATVSTCSGGYNGGGSSSSADAYVYTSGGGGATHIATTSGLLSTLSNEQSKILIVAGGGGGGNYYNYNSAGYKGYGGSGGGISGVAGTSSTSSNTSAPGTQSTGYTFGAGCSYYAGGGGGAGYIGGYCGWSFPTAGAGGSGYIANPLLISYGSTLKSMYCYNCTASTTESTLTYSTTNVSATATANYAKSGNGYAKITYVPGGYSMNTNLNNVRYIKDCINGSTVNTGNHWVEIKAMKNGANIAKNKTVTGTSSESASYPYSRIVDDDITTANYAQSSVGGSLQCVTVDLGSSNNLDEIAVWHYWGDARTYNSNVTYVSSDNSNWITVMDKTKAESILGKRVGARDQSLLTNTNFTSYTTTTYAWDNTLNRNPAIVSTGWSSGYNSGVTAPSTGYHARFDDKPFGYNVIVFPNLNSVIGQTGRWLGISHAFAAGTITPSTTYTIYFDVFDNAVGHSITGGLYTYDTSTSAYAFGSTMFTKTTTSADLNKWVTKQVTVTTPSTTSIANGSWFYIYGNSGAEGTAYIRNIYLEKV